VNEPEKHENFGALSPNLFLDFSQHVRFLWLFFNKSSKKTENASERDNKIFPKTKKYVVSLVLNLVFKIVFGIFYHLWFVSNLYNMKCLETSKSDLKVNSDPML
jgi:hypothetical protein